MSRTSRFQSVSPRVWTRAADVYGRGILLYGLFFKLRGLLMVPLLAAMLIATRWEWEHNLGVWATGLPLFMTGLALRVWSQRYLKYRIRLPRPELATDGPYAYVRNPVYLGNALLLIGLTVLCELPWMVPITLLWTATVYGLAIRFEEARLLRMFGTEYETYRRRVPGWIPRVGGGALMSRDRRVSLARAAAVEWHCLLFLLLPLAKELCVDGQLAW